MVRKLAALTAAAAMVFAACSSTGGSPAASGGTAKGCTVGVSWNNYDQERWKKADEPAIKKAVEAAGGKYIKADARDNSEQQITDIDTLINQGAKALIVLAKDAKAILPAIKKAEDAGIPVIAYDRLIEDPKAFYITFDNKKVGTIMAQVITKLVPKGNYAIIKGDPGDANAKFLRDGMDEGGLKALVDSGAVKIVFEQNTPNWDTTGATNEMQAALNAANNKIDAVLSENDGMATGVVAALNQVGLKIPVSGQDGDAAALNRVALGTQSVSVWKNAFALGETAGNVAEQLCGGTKPADIKAPADLPAAAAPASTTAQDFKTPGGNTVKSIVLTPTPITKDNLKDVIDAGWVTKDVVCSKVPAGSVPACG
ncbi:MAG: substrate-binding domain-containing protein [Chloroflexi bacterium]|nr:substrate-binding domain-containing protein [Chloroflexota bacterium]